VLFVDYDVNQRHILRMPLNFVISSTSHGAKASARPMIIKNGRIKVRGKTKTSILILAKIFEINNYWKLIFPEVRWCILRILDN
jgi:hypothetical protein